MCCFCSLSFCTSIADRTALCRTSYRLALPSDVAEKMFKLVPDARPLPSTSASSSAISYSYPCECVSSPFSPCRLPLTFLGLTSSTTLFSISFAHHTHALLPDEFNITPLASVEGKRCLAAVYGLRLLDEGANSARLEAEEILS